MSFLGGSSQLPPKSVEDQAIEIIAPRKLHQLFTLPATSDHGPMRVTYAVCGREDGEDVPTIVFSGGMFGSRWQAPFQDFIAKEKGVRLVYIDRPGFGGTDPVPLAQRLPIYLEIVPALLAHLNIKNIAIASQSAGTLFALNLLATQPHLLSPTNPSVTLFSPWVHQSHTGVSMLLAASMLPNFMLNHWADLTGFIINNAMPGFAASSGALSVVTNWFSSGVGGKGKEEESKKEWMEKLCMQGYGVDSDVVKEVVKLAMKYAFTEQSSGGNDEARLCLRSAEGSSWGELDEYPSYIERLKEVWEKKVQEGGAKLRVRILLAEEDAMIGEKGMKYLEECWTKEKCGEGIDVEIVVVEGADHDGVLDPAKGAIGEVYASVKEGRGAFPVVEGTDEVPYEEGVGERVLS